MDYNKATVKIGRVRSYDNSVGEIVTLDEKYIFTKDSIAETEELSTNDMVVFRGEEIQGMKRAFFIRRVTREKSLSIHKYTKSKTNNSI